LVHVAEIAPGVLFGVPFDSEGFQQETLTQSGELLRQVADLSGGSGAEQRVEWGSPAAALLKIAAELDALLIVIGTRSLGGLKAAALGSVSHRVTAEAPCPVVVVPSQARELPAT
jgi:nucleotide-binding universal stress UspA family protein